MDREYIKRKTSAKAITHKVYATAVENLNHFLDNHLVERVDCLPEQQGTYGFVVYY